MLRALKRHAHYSRIDTPTRVSFVLFPMAPEPCTTLPVYSCIPQNAVNAKFDLARIPWARISRVVATLPVVCC
jgi:hypothetical protein